MYSATKKLKIAVLISGRGSNLKALLEACDDKNFPAEVVLVLSNKAEAKGLDFAVPRKIKTATINHKNFKTREEFDREMDKEIVASGAEFVCLAGFMRLLSSWFCEKWNNKLINIHPSLLPSFKGIDVHKEVLKTGVKLTGCTVHFVRPEMDSGPIIVQSAVPVLSTDTEEDIAARVLKVEHKSYPLAVKLIAEGKVKIVDEKVIISGGNIPEPQIISAN